MNIYKISRPREEVNHTNTAGLVIIAHDEDGVREVAKEHVVRFDIDEDTDAWDNAEIELLGTADSKYNYYNPHVVLMDYIQ